MRDHAAQALLGLVAPEADRIAGAEPQVVEVDVAGRIEPDPAAPSGGRGAVAHRQLGERDAAGDPLVERGAAAELDVALAGRGALAAPQLGKVGEEPVGVGHDPGTLLCSDRLAQDAP